MNWSNQWHPDVLQEVQGQQDPLAPFKAAGKKADITEMTPEEVAEMWSDEIMALIRKQMTKAMERLEHA